MKILLSSKNRSTLSRWANALAVLNRVERAGSLYDFKDMLSQGKFDVILVHRPLIDRDKFPELHASSADDRFFLLSDSPDEDEGVFFLKHGAVGYGNSYMPRLRLVQAVNSISNGSVWVGQRIMQRLIAEVHARAKEDGAGTDEKSPALAALTARERQIAGLVAKGNSNLEIASALNITERTVKAHLTSIYEKTGIGNRLGLALLVNQG